MSSRHAQSSSQCGAKGLRLMSDAAQFVSCSISNKSRPWVDSGLHASISPLYARLSCRMLELAALMDEACAVAPEDEDVREENKDACSDNDASSAQDLDLADLYPTLYYFYLNKACAGHCTGEAVAQQQEWTRCMHTHTQRSEHTSTRAVYVCVCVCVRKSSPASEPRCRPMHALHADLCHVTSHVVSC